MRQATLVAVGSAVLALGAARRAAGLPPPPDRLVSVSEFALALLLAAEDRAAGAAARVDRRLTRLFDTALEAPFIGNRLASMREALKGEADRGRTLARQGTDEAAAAAHVLVAEVASAVIEEIDLDRVIEKVDLDRIIARVDLDRIVSRLDLDAIIARVDVNAVIDRIDLPAAAQRALSDENVDQIIRASTASVGADAVGELRSQGMAADRLLGGVVDRLLRRRAGRQLDLGPPNGTLNARK